MTRPIATDVSLVKRSYLEDRIGRSPDGCWLWTGTVVPLGYGRAYVDGRPRSAHRVVYEVFVGPLSVDLDLDHLCRVRRCVNPAHMEPVPHQENLMRGHTIVSRQAAQTHCINGHQFTRESTRIRPYSGGRTCRVCDRDRKRAVADARRVSPGTPIGADSG